MPSFSDWFADEAETTVAPAAGAPAPAEAPAEPEPAAEQPAEEPAEAEAPPELAPEPAEPTPAEQARVEHAGLGDTADHPAPEQLGPADEAEPEPHEGSPSSAAPEAPPAPAEEQPAEPPEPPESGIFEADEVDLGEDIDHALEPDEEPRGDSVVSSPTTDHDLPPAPVERRTEGEDEEEKEGADGDDLLEETPDFLREAPEGEDLWFEQGPPKDFDFDDD